MVLGFAFRSPDIIRLTIDRTKFAAFVIPKYNVSGAHKAAYVNALKTAVANRKRVMLFSDCESLASLSQDPCFDKNKHIYVVFDSSSTLASKTCVNVLDINSSATIPTWQSQKALPSVLAKVLAATTEGITDPDLECIKSTTENPEDRIKTDVPKRSNNNANENAKQLTYLEEIQKITQHPDLAKRNEVRALLAMLLAGRFARSDEQSSKKRNLRGLGERSISTFKKVYLKVQVMRAIARAKKLDIDLSKFSDSMTTLFEHYGYRGAVLGMYLIESNNQTADKAASETGGDISYLAWFKTSILVADSSKKISGKYLDAKPCFLRSVVKSKSVAEDVADKTKASSEINTRIGIPCGYYSEEQLLRACKLLKQGENYAAIKASRQGSSFATNIPRFKGSTNSKSKAMNYKVSSNTKYFIKYRSKRLKVLGI